MSKSKWSSYSESFYKEAIKSGYSEYQISSYLDYAQNLFISGVPIIFDQIHLSLLVGYKFDYLLRISASQEKFYNIYQIPKKSSGTRTIAEPLPDLKIVQRWILENILSKIKVSKFAKAYIKGKSIRSNAWFHQQRDIIVRIDINDFFGSINYKKIYNTFSGIGYNKPVSTLLGNLCVLDNKLPQGAPTSPALSNIVFTSIDKRISSFVVGKDIRYTRYADDLTFSGNFKPGMIIKFVKSVLSENGLEINIKKTRVLKKHQRQLITGVVVNEGMHAPREMRRKLRQSVYFIEQYGLSSHLDMTNNDRANHVRHLLGIANFILFIDPNDSQALKSKRILSKYLDD